jgi:hypothetical protein
MIIWLAFLAVGESRALTVSAPLDVQAPATCEYGPNIPPPAPAAATGFNHCALNADFSQPGGYFSNPANFMDCAGARTSSRFFMMFQWTTYKAAPCDRFSIVMDGTSQAARLQFFQTDQNNFVHLNWPWQENWQSGPIGFQGGPNGLGLPFQGYFELTWRAPASTLNAVPSGQGWMPIAFWLRKDDQYSATSWIETDFFEISTGRSSPSSGWPWHLTAMRDWTCAPGCSGIVTPGGGWRQAPVPAPACGSDCGDADWDEVPMDFTVYHKYGFLVTSDESTALAMCLYVDDQLRRCQKGSAGSNPALQYKQMHNFITIWLGPQVGSIASGVELDMYLQSIRVFECNDYASSTCPTPVYCPTGACYDGAS